VQRLDLDPLCFFLLGHGIRGAQPGARLVHLRRTGASLAAHGLLLRSQFLAQGFDLRAHGRQSALLGRALQAKRLGIQFHEDLALLHLTV
jgi:hypothetical protein